MGTLTLLAFTATLILVVSALPHGDKSHGLHKVGGGVKKVALGVIDGHKGGVNSGFGKKKDGKPCGQGNNGGRGKAQILKDGGGKEYLRIGAVLGGGRSDGKPIRIVRHIDGGRSEQDVNIRPHSGKKNGISLNFGGRRDSQNVVIDRRNRGKRDRQDVSGRNNKNRRSRSRHNSQNVVIDRRNRGKRDRQDVSGRNNENRRSRSRRNSQNVVIDRRNRDKRDRQDVSKRSNGYRRSRSRRDSQNVVIDRRNRDKRNRQNVSGRSNGYRRSRSRRNGSRRSGIKRRSGTRRSGNRRSGTNDGIKRHSRRRRSGSSHDIKHDIIGRHSGSKKKQQTEKYSEGDTNSLRQKNTYKKNAKNTKIEYDTRNTKYQYSDGAREIDIDERIGENVQPNHASDDSLYSEGNLEKYEGYEIKDNIKPSYGSAKNDNTQSYQDIDDDNKNKIKIDKGENAQDQTKQDTFTTENSQETDNIYNYESTIPATINDNIGSFEYPEKYSAGSDSEDMKNETEYQSSSLTKNHVRLKKNPEEQSKHDTDDNDDRFYNYGDGYFFNQNQNLESSLQNHEELKHSQSNIQYTTDTDNYGSQFNNNDGRTSEVSKPNFDVLGNLGYQSSTNGFDVKEKTVLDASNYADADNQSSANGFDVEEETVLDDSDYAYAGDHISSNGFDVEEETVLDASNYADADNQSSANGFDVEEETVLDDSDYAYAGDHISSNGFDVEEETVLDASNYADADNQSSANGFDVEEETVLDDSDYAYAGDHSSSNGFDVKNWKVLEASDYAYAGDHSSSNGFDVEEETVLDDSNYADADDRSSTNGFDVKNWKVLEASDYADADVFKGGLQNGKTAVIGGVLGYKADKITGNAGREGEVQESLDAAIEVTASAVTA